VGYEDFKIRDVSRLSGEWAPPIGALGGPPAAELYRDLVVFAGLQLFRDSRSRPWVVLRDGSQRRAFPVPSVELRYAIDRFRMRRNVRTVPEGDIDEFTRIVEARVSDPDVEIPVLKAPVAEHTPVSNWGAGPAVPPNGGTGPGSALSSPATTAPANGNGHARPEVAAASVVSPPLTVTASLTPEASARPVPWYEVNASVSGGRLLSARGQEHLSRYVRVLRGLVHDGDWMGTTRELSELTRDDPLTVYDALMRYRSDLAENDILVATVEVGDGYRWLAVDRTKFRREIETRPPDAPPLPAG
jgi:hypothetical protein